MADFFQNGIITTLHKLGHRPIEDLEKEIHEAVEHRPISLILPALYSEFETPAMHRILGELQKITYIDEIVLSLDRANQDQYIYVMHLMKELPMNVHIVWNDGPRVNRLRQILNDLGFPFNIAGKGRAVWMALGFVLARQEAYMIALHDCDIVNYHRGLLARLVYPVVSPRLDFEFAKGYYARFTEKLYGRVTRLFFTPLVRALKRMLGPIEYLEYLDSFRYPLSGEFTMLCHMAESIRISPDWGLEISTLGEVYQNTSLKRICQVEILDSYEHKHQKIGFRDPSRGLMRMCMDISQALFRFLSQDGIVMSEEFFRTLTVAYLREARSALDKYQALAYINGLRYDLDRETKAVEAFVRSLEMAIREYKNNPLGVPLMPSWSRVVAAEPSFPDAIIEAVNEDKEEFDREVVV